MFYQNIREEELKNKVAQDYFWIYDCSRIVGNVDFCVAMHQSHNSPPVEGLGEVEQESLNYPAYTNNWESQDFRQILTSANAWCF